MSLLAPKTSSTCLSNNKGCSYKAALFRSGSSNSSHWILLCGFEICLDRCSTSSIGSALSMPLILSSCRHHEYLSRCHCHLCCQHCPCDLHHHLCVGRPAVASGARKKETFGIKKGSLGLVAFGIFHVSVTSYWWTTIHTYWDCN